MFITNKNIVPEHALYNNLTVNNVVLTTNGRMKNLVKIADSLLGGLVNFKEKTHSVILYPIDIPSSNAGLIWLGGSVDFKTPIRGYEISKTVMYYNCGEVYVEPQFNDFRDYSGYTKLQLFLPYYGYVDLDTDLFMGKWLQVRLKIDYLNGMGLYIVGYKGVKMYRDVSKIWIYSSDQDDFVITNTFNAQIGIEIPFTDVNLGEQKRNALIGGIQTAVSLGALSANIYIPPTSTKTYTTNYTEQIRSSEKYSRLKNVKQIQTSSEQTYKKDVSIGESISDIGYASSNALSRALSLNTSNPTLASNLYNCLSQRCILRIVHPKYQDIDFQEQFKSLYGKPLGKIKKLGELAGYTKISNLHIENNSTNYSLFSSITDIERSDLEKILLSGIKLPANPDTVVFSLLDENGQVQDVSTFNFNDYNLIVPNNYTFHYLFKYNKYPSFLVRTLLDTQLKYTRDGKNYGVYYDSEFKYPAKTYNIINQDYYVKFY